MRIHKTIACAAAIAVGMPLTAALNTSAGATDKPTTQQTAAAKKVKSCKGKQLRVTFGKTGAAAGTFYRTVRFRNTKKRCAVRSWPQVGYASKRGRPVGFLATHPHKRRTLVLRHGEVGRVALGTPEWRNYPRRACGPRRAAKLAVYIPGRISAGARHLKKIPKGPMKVCTSNRGRPSLSRLR